MIETKISSFHTSFYIAAIQELSFHLPHVRILGTNRCFEIRCTALKSCQLFLDVICCSDYAERLVASFYHKIQSEYYCVNRSMYIEGFALENFSALPKADINSTTKSRQHHAVFHYFLSYDSKQDATTNTAEINSFIALIKDKKVLTTYLSTI